jgi:septum formation protein
MKTPVRGPLGLPFILASASPRRRKLMKSFPFPVTVTPSRVHEPRARSGERPDAYALGLAEKKAREVAKRLKSGLVLGADTVVYHGGKILGKPADAAEARRILARLTGRWHDVYTGLYLAVAPSGKGWKVAVRTRVKMRKFTAAQLDRWSLKNHDKAGAYAAQAPGNPFVVDYRGDYDNVIGLPRRALRRLLRSAKLGRRQVVAADDA